MSTTMTSPAQQLQQEIEESGRIDSRSIDFYQELLDYGIESLEQFEDSYQGEHRSGALFAEELCQDCGFLGLQSDIPDFILNHIDWDAVWSCELRFDYFSIEAGGYMYIFRNF